MRSQISFVGKSLATSLTFEWSFSSMSTHVVLKVCSVFRDFATNVTLMFSCSGLALLWYKSIIQMMALQEKTKKSVLKDLKTLLIRHLFSKMHHHM
jgi:hypothetical protein